MEIGKRPSLNTIVFDFDGTLAELKLDFSHMKVQLHQLATRDFALNVDVPNMPALEWIDVLCIQLRSRNGDHHELFRAMALKLIVEMEMEAARNGQLFPFTRTLLRELAHCGIKVAIITRNCGEAVRCVFPDMSAYCSTLLTRDDVPRVKPHPDHLLQALHRLDSTPESCLMVGDHPLDLETGRRAGTLTAGVSTGRVTEEDLLRSGAHMTARNCWELLQALRHAQWLTLPQGKTVR